MSNERRHDPYTPRPNYSRGALYHGGGQRDESDYYEFDREWRSDEGDQYFGAGGHYGGGFGTAPSSRASSAGAEGAFGYARQGAWSDPDDWTPEDERNVAPEYGSAPISYRGRGPRGYTRSDERLLESICERLTDDPRIDASDIEVQVQQQVVTLRGSVEDRLTKYAVEELVESAGARDIQNQLRVIARR
jgi:osmotically-inducible protein OsmY